MEFQITPRLFVALRDLSIAKENLKDIAEHLSLHTDDADTLRDAIAQNVATLQSARDRIMDEFEILSD